MECGQCTQLGSVLSPPQVMLLDGGWLSVSATNTTDTRHAITLQYNNDTTATEITVATYIPVQFTTISSVVNG